MKWRCLVHTFQTVCQNAAYCDKELRLCFFQNRDSLCVHAAAVRSGSRPRLLVRRGLRRIQVRHAQLLLVWNTVFQLSTKKKKIVFLVWHKETTLAVQPCVVKWCINEPWIVTAGPLCGSPQLPLSLWPAGIRSDVCFRRRCSPNRDKLSPGPSCLSITTGTPEDICAGHNSSRSVQLSVHNLRVKQSNKQSWTFQAELWHPHHSHGRPIGL